MFLHCWHCWASSLLQSGHEAGVAIFALCGCGSIRCETAARSVFGTNNFLLLSKHMVATARGALGTNYAIMYEARRTLILEVTNSRLK